MPSSVTLTTADVALFSDPATTRVTIPRLRDATPTRTREGVRTRFAGDTRATSFRGEGDDRARNLVARYLAGEQQQMVDLLDLFDAAHTAVDGRLMLRTHLGLVAGFDPLEVVVVFSDTATPVDYGCWDVSFTVEAVDYTLEI